MARTDTTMEAQIHVQFVQSESDWTINVNVVHVSRMTVRVLEGVRLGNMVRLG